MNLTSNQYTTLNTFDLKTKYIMTMSRNKLKIQSNLLYILYKRYNLSIKISCINTYKYKNDANNEIHKKL